jgi:hypothetical protein
VETASLDHHEIPSRINDIPIPGRDQEYNLSS